MILDELAAKTLVPLLPRNRGVEFAIDAIYAHRHHLSTKVRSFIDLLAERFAQHRKWIKRGGRSAAPTATGGI